MVKGLTPLPRVICLTDKKKYRGAPRKQAGGGGIGLVGGNSLTGSPQCQTKYCDQPSTVNSNDCVKFAPEVCLFTEGLFFALYALLRAVKRLLLYSLRPYNRSELNGSRKGSNIKMVFFVEA